VHHFEGGWVDRVAPEIAKEVRVLLEDNNLEPCAGEEEAQHDAGGPAACNGALHRDRLLPGLAGHRLARMWLIGHRVAPLLEPSMTNLEFQARIMHSKD